ncbi:RHS repeat-associated core domain-containing protein [Plantactinospora sp. B6F1]|uniref:RHS repeat-associated core domain-containing protein n=1 Tax=Plantactinospora sp. B6F1 TaxID=3158971 RepID=UPI0032D91FDF
MSLVLVATLADAVPASARPAPDYWKTAGEQSVPGRGVTVPEPGPDPAEERALRGTPAVTWPKPGATEITLGTARQSGAEQRNGTAQQSGRASAGTLPVRVSAAGTAPAGASTAAETASATPARVRVELKDRYLDGLLLDVRRADGVARDGRVSLEVDYSGFRDAFGADWAVRLRLVKLPACAVTTPERPECVGTPVATRNNGSGRLSAEVTAPGTLSSAARPTDAGLYAVVAAASSGAGDFKASPMAPSSMWTVGTSSGDFGWRYPLDAPPAVGGPEPELELSYSSGGVDGRTSATNNQPSWVGEGFDFSPGGHIERRYTSCGTDTAGGNNSGHKTGDMCWATDNAVFSLNGKGGELILDDETGKWRPRVDDGSRVERLFDAPNGDYDGEYWRITTQDGTQYFFGKHKIPGSEVTNSTWTLPVYGNQKGEPCYKSTFDASHCAQAWRWNLDFVVDVHGNAMSLYYERESNFYGRNMSASKVSAYDRGGWLARIDYGHRVSDETVVTPPTGRVVLTPADRCIPGTTCTSSQPANWPDVPWDQACTSSTKCTNKHSPTFWTQKRLAKVTSQIRRGSAFADVESWTLRHSYPSPGDGTRAGLWLDGIKHSGHVGGTDSDPEVAFTGTRLNNRVDGNDYIPPMNWFRVVKVQLDSGGEVAVEYSPGECSGPDNLPTPDSNAMRCHPLRWTPEGEFKEREDWFHKYIVTQVTESDRTTGLEPEVTKIDYLTTPAWRHDEEDGLVPTERKTWSQWRGYGKVRMTKGTADEVRTVTEALFFRGMDGDKTDSGGTKEVFVKDSTNTTWRDSDPLAGTERESITYNQDGTVQERSITDPWVSDPTASRTRSWGTTKAFKLEEAKVRQAETTGSGGWQNSGSDNVYDVRTGRLTQTADLNDLADPNDDTCTRYTYVDNEAAWLKDLPVRVETVGVSCDRTPSYPADLISDERYYYDGSNTLGATPTRGDVTRKEELSGWVNGAPTYVTTMRASYDAHGRQIETIDVKGARTAMTFTPATGGPVTAATTTNPLGHVTSTTLEPAWGEDLVVTDPNGRRTVSQYDPLGRVTKMWGPDRNPATDTPTAEFSYLIRNNGANAVTTRSLQPDGTYQTEYELYDGFMRPRQTQEPAPGGGRIVTDTVHNSRGLEVRENGPYYNDAPPGPDVLIVDEQLLPAQTQTVYDHADRPVAEIFKVGGVERWRTTHTYGHNRHDIDPPDGETPTTRITDVDGHLLELRQYHGNSPTGAYDSTRYTYTKRGQLASVTDPAGNVWRYGYDLRGRMIRSEDPDRGVTELTYNDAGEKIGSRDARGVNLAFAYDALGRMTAVHEGSLSGPKRAAWTFDVLPDGTPARGEQTATTRYVNGNAYTTAVAGYDAAGRPTGTKYTIPASEGALAGTYQFTNTYHTDGEIASLGSPAAGGLPAEQVTIGYNRDGLPSSLRGQSSYVTGASYTPYGELAQVTMSAGGKWVRSSYSYEYGTHRLNRAIVERETGPSRLVDLTYSHDAAGNLTRLVDTADPDTGGGPETQCFRHDYLRRLAEAWTPESGNCATAPSAAGLGGPAAYWHAWTYDKTGNRLSESRTDKAGTTKSTYSYPAAGQAQPHTVRSVTTTGPNGTRTDSYGYDAIGNTTSRTRDGKTLNLSWDAEGHLAGTTGAETSGYVYDVDGERLIRRDSSGTTLYLGTTELHLSPNGAVTGTRYYEFAGRTVAVRTSADNKLHWLGLDHHGTPEVAIDATTQQVHRRRHTPFGEVRGINPDYWPGQKSFVGGVKDQATGLVQLGVRGYDPSLGRFISIDPVIDYTDPQQMNGYAYANNSPTTYSDPDGKWGFITRVIKKTVTRAVVHKVVRHVTNLVRVPVTIVKNEVKRRVTQLRKIHKKIVRKVKKIHKKVVKIKKRIRTAAKKVARSVGKKVRKGLDGVRRAAKHVGATVARGARAVQAAVERTNKALAQAAMSTGRWVNKNITENPVWKAAKMGLSAAALVGCAICGGIAAGMTAVDMLSHLAAGNGHEAAFEAFGLVTFGLGRAAAAGARSANGARQAAGELAENAPNRAARIAETDRLVKHADDAAEGIDGFDGGLLAKDVFSATGFPWWEDKKG